MLPARTLIAVGRAAAAQYAKVMPVEHVYPLVRTVKQLDRVPFTEIEESPGIILYTLLSIRSLWKSLRVNLVSLGLPCLSVLGPVFHLFQAYLGAESTHKVGAQHTLNAEYFRRIDALRDYTMLHDDGPQQAEDLEEASMSFFLACRARRKLRPLKSTWLIAASRPPIFPWCPEWHCRRILSGSNARSSSVYSQRRSGSFRWQIRQNRLLGLKVQRDDDHQYIDREAQ